MTKEWIKQARIIRRHYGYKKPLSPAEVEDTIFSLTRKAKRGSLDTRDEGLASALGIRWPDLLVLENK